MSTMDVSVILRLDDRLSGAAKKAAASLNVLVNQAKSLNAIGAKGFAGLKVFEGLDKTIASSAKSLNLVQKNITGIDVALRRATNNARSFERTITSIGAANPWIAQTASMREYLAVQREMLAGQRAMLATTRRLDAAQIGGAAAAVAGGARRGGGGGRTRGGAHLGVSPIGLPVPGGHAHIRGSNAALLGAGALGYSIYEAAQLEDQVALSLWHAQMAPTTENKKRFSDIIKNAMTATGLPLQDVGHAVQNELRMFRGTPGGGLDVLPEMLKAAAVEAKVKGTSLEESMTSLIGLAHMTKSYDPAAIKKLAPVFAFLSSSNPASLSSIERAAGYAVPMLQSGLEVDPLQTLLLGTALTRAGATNTKSGTWLREMALRAMPGTSLMSRTAFKKHEEALRAFGLVDEKGQPTWFTDDKPDLIKMLDTAGSHAASIPLAKRAAYERALFGAQGGGGFALLSDPKVHEQIANLKAEMPQFAKMYPNFLDMYRQESPVQQARVTFAEAKTVLMDIGEMALPPVVAGLKALQKVLHAIKDTFGDKAAGVAGAGLGGAALLALTRPGQFLRGASRLLAGGAAAAGQAIPAAGAIAAGSRLASLARVGGRFAGPVGAAAALGLDLYSIHSDIASGKHNLTRTADEYHAVASGRLLREQLRRQFASDTAEQTLDFVGLPRGSKTGGFTLGDIQKTFAPTDMSQQGAKAGQSWFDAALSAMKGLSSETIPGPQITPPAIPQSYKAPAAPAAPAEKQANIGPVHIHVHGAGNPHDVAKAVHAKFLASVERHLSDGAYAS